MPDRIPPAKPDEFRSPSKKEEVSRELIFQSENAQKAFEDYCPIALPLLRWPSRRKITEPPSQPTRKTTRVAREIFTKILSLSQRFPR